MTNAQVAQNRGGFTVAEVLLAALAVSVLMAIFLPQFTATMDDLAVRHATEQFTGAHKRARTAATTYGRTATVRIADNRVWVEIDTTFARTGEATTIGTIVDLADSGVSLEASTTSLCFEGSGLAKARGTCAVAGSKFKFSKGNSAQIVAPTATGVAAP